MLIVFKKGDFIDRNLYPKFGTGNVKHMIEDYRIPRLLKRKPIKGRLTSK